MAHRNGRNVGERSSKMNDDDDREERDRFVHEEHDSDRSARDGERRRVVGDDRDDDDEREERNRFVHWDDRVRQFVGSMAEAERQQFIDERTRMFDDEERGRLFGGNRTFRSSTEDRTRERPRSHGGSSRFPERHRGR